MASRRQQPPNDAGLPASRSTAATTRIPLSVKNVQPRGTGDDVAEEAQLKPSATQQQQPTSRLASAKHIVASRSAAVAAAAAASNIGLRTPQKRAIPREEVHPRNIVDEDDEASPPHPHKKSRSSKSEREGGESANTSQSISNELNQMNVDEEGPQPPQPQPRNNTEPIKTAATPSLAPTTTTTRIDKHSRLSAAERAAKDEHTRLTRNDWRKKYIAAFTKFAFYLDGFDDKSKEKMTIAIQRCGGRVEPFFDKSCSHVVANRKTPATATTTTAPSTSSSRLPSAVTRKVDATAAAAATAATGAATKRFSPSKKGLGRKNRETPLHSDRNPFEDTIPSMASNASDVVRKATDLGIKVWTLDKFWTTMNFLFGTDAASTGPSSATKQDLAKMLEHERIHGTSERDLSAPQSGYRYLDKRNDVFVLVGDATEEHHAIIFQQYAKPEDPNERPPWPKLYGEHEGRCPFTKYSRRKEREREQREAEDEARKKERQAALDRAKLEAATTPGPEPSRAYHRLDSLRREQSKDSLRASASPAPESRVFERGASPYQLASGNSVSVASNMTSAQYGSTASVAGSLYGSHGIIAGVSTPSFALQDKRVAQLGRRMVSAASPANTMPTPDGSHAMARSSSVPRATDPVAHGALVRQMLGMTNESQKVHHATHPAQPHAQAPPRQHPARPHAAAAAAAAHAAAQAAAAEQEAAAAAAVAAAKKDKEKKAFYCENCRKGFNNFDRHISSAEHRRFATNDNNFANLDSLLARLIRPPAPWIHKPECEYILRHARGEDVIDDDEDGDEGCEDVGSIVGEDAAYAYDGAEQGEGEESYETHAGQSLEWNTSIEENEGHLTPGTSPGLQGDYDDGKRAEEDEYLDPYIVGEAL